MSCSTFSVRSEKLLIYKSFKRLFRECMTQRILLNWLHGYSNYWAVKQFLYEVRNHYYTNHSRDYFLWDITQRFLLYLLHDYSKNWADKQFLYEVRNHYYANLSRYFCVINWAVKNNRFIYTQSLEIKATHQMMNNNSV